jgi:hypothetical protein
MVKEDLQVIIDKLNVRSTICNERLMMAATKCIAEAMLELLDRTDKIEDRLPFRPTGCGPL